MLCAVDLGSSGDFVACVLGYWLGCLSWECVEGFKRALGMLLTVSMYSLFAALGGGILKMIEGFNCCVKLQLRG